MKNQIIYEDLLLCIKEENIIENCSMKEYTSFRAGGNADFLIEPQDEEQLKNILKLIASKNIASMVLGNGSNLLVRDEGYKGVIIKLGEAFSKTKVVWNTNKENAVISAGVGIMLSTISKEVADCELTGLEFASGIPGSLGGAVFMNAGAYGGEIKDVIKRVRAISKDGQQEYYLEKQDLNLSYRHSVFHENGDIIVTVELELNKGNKEEIKARMKDLMNKRNEKQPVNYPSCGSFFKRPEGCFAGKLIEDAGLKGLSIGGAQISKLHSGFIINRENASAKDIIDLMEVVRNTVYDKYQVMLEPEVRIIGG